MSLTPGVYLISNKASGTVVDLGQLAQGTKIHAWASAQQLTYFFNQLWLIEQVVGQPYYTVRNLRSNLFLDLYLGSTLNGTDLVGWNFNGSAAQQWDIKGNSQAGYM